ncbi:MAG: hypothetical protein IPL79_17800 [Myxococcales bacterium]|nr:hypothetical protein [Myxococcales bacterium]
MANLADFGIPLIVGGYCAALGRDMGGAWGLRLPVATRRLIGWLGAALVVVTLLRMAMALYLAQRA